MISRYQITNTATGETLGTYVAASKRDALDQMARDAGYRDYDHAKRVAPTNHIVVIEV